MNPSHEEDAAAFCVRRYYHELNDRLDESDERHHACARRRREEEGGDEASDGGGDGWAVPSGVPSPRSGAVLCASTLGVAPPPSGPPPLSDAAVRDAEARGRDAIAASRLVIAGIGRDVETHIARWTAGARALCRAAAACAVVVFEVGS